MVTISLARTQKKVKGKKALPSAPRKVKGKRALPSAPPIDPPTSKRRTRSTIASETTPLGVGDWLTNKDIVCWWNQEVCHNEIREPRAWTLAGLYFKRLSKCMRRVESCTRLDSTGGVSPRFWYVIAPPPPALRAHLIAKRQQLLAIHMVAPKAPEKKFSFPLPILSTLHPNTILEPNLDSNAHPNPQLTPNPTPKPYP